MSSPSETFEQVTVALDTLPGSLEDCEQELDLHEKLLEDLATKQKEIIKVQTESEKLFQEKGFDEGVQRLAKKMKLLQQQWDDASQVKLNANL